MPRQLVGPCPRERLRVERLRLSVIGRNLPDIEQHATVGIIMSQANERLRIAHGDAEFLGELAHHGEDLGYVVGRRAADQSFRHLASVLAR